MGNAGTSIAVGVNFSQDTMCTYLGPALANPRVQGPGTLGNYAYRFVRGTSRSPSAWPPGGDLPMDQLVYR